MSGPQPLDRDELRKFLPSQRAIRAFEQLFATTTQLVETVPPELTAIKLDILAIQDELLIIQGEILQLFEELAGTTLTAGNADARATQALDVIDRLANAVALLATAPAAAIGTMAAQDADRVEITGGTVAARLTNNDGTLIRSNVALTNGAGAAAGTLANAPSIGNPSKWVPINDNGTTRYIPAW